MQKIKHNAPLQDTDRIGKLSETVWPHLRPSQDPAINQGLVQQFQHTELDLRTDTVSEPLERAERVYQQLENHD